jgi:hypothetical protein
MKFSELSSIIKSKNAELKNYKLPIEVTYTDNQLIADGRKLWIDRRDKKFKMIRELIDPETIEEYLFGGGITKEIEGAMKYQQFNSRGHYYHALNRFITFGCTANALLPFKLRNTGSNYLHSTKEKNIKRGRGGINNENSRSKTQGITVEAKQQIIQVVKYVKSKHYKKFPITKLFADYQLCFEMVEISRPGIATAYLPKPESERISYGQFRYHFRILITNDQYLKLCYGDVTYAKDFAPKSGVARDGVIGPGYRYEIDSTVLDLYVRYPYDLTGRYTMGRPVVYIVVDVYSTCIVGFYIGFSGPDWSGASEALVNACTDKVKYCAEFDIEITEDEWPCNHIPVEITMDNGTDYPVRMNTSLLQSMVGIQSAIYVALFRGDAKGVCERKFAVLNDQVIHYEPGSIFKETRREDNHPSNDAIWDLDALKKLLIREIIYHNKTSDRLRLHNYDMSKHSIGITPNAIYSYGIDREMNGGRKTTEEDLFNLRWALLDELQATVEETGVRLQGIYYDSEYIHENNWLTRASLEGNFKIFVRRTKSSTNCIWYRTERGDIITLHIKEYESGKYANQHWDCVLHRIEEYKNQAHDLANQRLAERGLKEGVTDSDRALQQEIANFAPKNTRKSAQPNIKERRNVQKAVEKVELAKTIIAHLSPEKVSKLPPHVSNTELDIDFDYYNS